MLHMFQLQITLKGLSQEINMIAKVIAARVIHSVLLDLLRILVYQSTIAQMCFLLNIHVTLVSSFDSVQSNSLIYDFLFNSKS